MVKCDIYADNAATSPLSQKALEDMVQYLSVNFANPSQLYSFAQKPYQAINNARVIIADCIGAFPEEIIFTSCGTESDNWVIREAIKRKLSIITSSIEHHAILKPCEAAIKEGISVKYLPVSSAGTVSASSLQKEMLSNSMISIMYANNEIGSILPIKELCKIAHSSGSIFHTDAVQAVGHIPINVHDIGVDLLSASAHKFNGPKGIGFLYVKKGLKISPYIMGGGQEHELRSGTENVASIVGMASALQENVDTLNDNTKHLTKLENIIINTLSESSIFFLRNGALLHIPGNLSLSFPGLSGESILHCLDLMKIYVSTGSACNSRNTKTSHVLRAIGLDDNTAKGTIRISLGKNNTIEDANIIAHAIIKIIHMQNQNSISNGSEYECSNKL